MVTVGYACRVGQETHLYEIDLTRTAAEELAVRLIRRAHEIRSDAVDDEACESGAADHHARRVMTRMCLTITLPVKAWSGALLRSPARTFHQV